MNLSPKAQAALDRVVARFQSGDIGPLVEIAQLRRTDDAPSARWSLSNQVIAYMQTGSLDCRGYRQWQTVGRQVQKGSRAAFILAPLTFKAKDQETSEEVTGIRGFRAVPVFPYHATDGDDRAPVEYTPAQLPPLADVAQQMGIAVDWQPLLSALGSCTVTGERISVGTHDPAPFFHELAHAMHAALDGRLKAGQDPHQETVAEFSACVLMALYGLGDRTGNAWQYIASYNPDPLIAITKAIATVEKVLALLLTPVSEATEVRTA